MSIDDALYIAKQQAMVFGMTMAVISEAGDYFVIPACKTDEYDVILREIHPPCPNFIEK